MKRIIRWCAIAIAGILVVLTGLSFLIDANRFKPALESNLAAALNREVKLGALTLSILSGGMTASDLSIADDPAFNQTPFLRAKSLHVEVELRPLIFSRKLNINGITIDEPEIVLLQTPSGDWNISSLGTKAAATPAQAAQPSSDTESLDLVVKQLTISNGRLTLGRTSGHWKPLVLEHLTVNLQDFSRTSVFPFSLSTNVAGSTIKIDGKAGPLNPADASMLPVSAKLSVADLDLQGSGLNEHAPAMAGLISFEGSGDSDGSAVQIKGKITAEKLKLAKNGTPASVPVQFDFAAEHNLRKHSGTLSRGDVHIGKAPASLSGTYFEQGESMILKMNLAGMDMPVTELAGMLPALAIVLPSGSSLKGGTLSAKMSLDGAADKLTAGGTLALGNTRLSGFDLGKKLSVIGQLAGIRAGSDTEIQNLSANVRVSPEGTSLQDIKLIVPGIGELRGAGTISPANALAFKMSAIVRSSGLAAVLANTSIPFLVQGTSSNPVFKPDINALASEKIRDFLQGLLGGRKKN